MPWCNKHRLRYELRLCPMCMGAPVVVRQNEAIQSDPSKGHYTSDVPTTTAHLLSTADYELGHIARHLDALHESKDQKERDFNYKHAKEHLESVTDHLKRLTEHIQANYPKEGDEFSKVMAASALPDSVLAQKS